RPDDGDTGRGRQLSDRLLHDPEGPGRRLAAGHLGGGDSAAAGLGRQRGGGRVELGGDRVPRGHPGGDQSAGLLVEVPVEQQVRGPVGVDRVAVDGHRNASAGSSPRRNASTATWPTFARSARDRARMPSTSTSPRSYRTSSWL